MILITIIVGLIFIINIIRLHYYVIKSYDIESEKLEQSQKMILLSDLHMSEYGKGNCRLVNDVTRIHPDVILIAGDMITTYPAAYDGVRNNYGWAERMASFLGELSEIAPVMLVDGNHEIVLKSAYDGAYLPVCDMYEKMLKLNNVNLLYNKSFILEKNVCIYGLNLDVEYYEKRKEIQLTDNVVEELLGLAEEGKFTILLTHNPKYFKTYASWGADLVLCGHVHGGVFRLGNKGLVGPERKFFPKYCYGEYREENSTMIVSSGLGSQKIPIRIGNPMELVVVNLIPKRKG